MVASCGFSTLRSQILIQIVYSHHNRNITFRSSCNEKLSSYCLNFIDLLPHEWKSASRAILKWKCYGFVSIIYWLMAWHNEKKIHIYVTENIVPEAFNSTWPRIWNRFIVCELCSTERGVFVSRCKLSKTIENVWLYWNIGQFMLKENVLNVPRWPLCVMDNNI